jgi:3-hydroxy-3-methylglutaryl CoA synthase
MAAALPAGKSALVLAGEERDARAASAQEFDYGDGGAAFEVGAGGEAARFLGGYTVTADFVDRFRGATERFDYAWEERWIRDEGYAKLVPEAVRGALDAAGVAAGELSHIVLPCPFPGVPQKLMAKLGADPERVRDTLAGQVGDTGAAHALLMLSLCLEEARPGEKILVVQFGQGAEAAIFEATEQIADARPAAGVSGWLARRTEEANYMKMLTFKGLIEWEKGMRAEKDAKTALSVLYRKDDLITGFTGGQCTQCGTIQIPRSRLCVNPNCGAADSQEPVRLAFRIKDFDEVRGFRRYFWKAVPQP